MKLKRDALDVVRTFADEPSRANSAPAERLTEELYGEASARRGAVAAAAKPRMRIALYLAGAALLLSLCILLCFLLSGSEEPSYYHDGNAVEGWPVDDIAAFADENGLSFRSVEGGLSSQFEVFYLREEGSLAYIQQQTLFLTEDGFDGITLGICFSKDRFQSFAAYEYPDRSTEVEGVTVEYRIEEDEISDIYACLSTEGLRYYLHITTAGGAERLERYIGILLR